MPSSAKDLLSPIQNVLRLEQAKYIFEWKNPLKAKSIENARNIRKEDKQTTESKKDVKNVLLKLKEKENITSKPRLPLEHLSIGFHYQKVVQGLQNQLPN